MRMQAVFNGAVIAESDDMVLVEGNHYFPTASIRQEFFQPSSSHTLCPWKGTASYYDLDVNGIVNHNAAWYYPRPSLLARKIKGRIAFWHGVRVVPAEDQLAS